MELKPYQNDTLKILRKFLEEARVAGPAGAYESVTAEPEQARRLGRYRTGYVALEGLPGTPYVCLRLPTGGGKTLLAAHSIGVARDAWVEKDYPLVLWLVPTNTIRLQTVEALRNVRHAYRRVLDEMFEGRVRVFDIADFRMIRPQDLRDSACVVVGTIQTLRVDKTEGRKVYEHDESLEPHFSGLAGTMEGLERQRGSGSGVRYSFANLLHLHRPLMIVDEAHNAVTGLTRDMQARVNPCAIIEFTATPKLNSNILHSVTAQELKVAEMIKLPIILAEHDSWQNAVNGAIASRAALAAAAADEADYVRPIVLLQAQPRNQEVTAEVLKKHLMEVEQIAAERIAVVTGEQRELDGIDLFDPQCRVEFVITIEALKEGWDCSFAYVFCSVSRIQNATDVEQLLGRVLRMPYARRRRAEALNRAYAHVSEPAFGAAANALVDRLVAMGFDEEEAQEAVEPVQGALGEGGLFGARGRPAAVFRHRIEAGAEVVAALEGAGVGVTAVAGGAVEIAVTGRVAPALEAQIAAVLPAAARAGFAEAVQQYRLETKDELSFAERGVEFRVPRLMAWVQGNFEFADTDVFMEFHEWSLAAHPARLDERAFAIRETARSFEIDVDGRRVAYQFASEEEQLALDVDVEGWSAEGLVGWLSRQLREPDILHRDLVRWLADCVGYLVGRRKIHIAALMRTKFILARNLRERIGAARAAERARVYQRCLFEPGARVEVSFDEGFSFRDGMYWNVRKQPAGRWKPRKHFLGVDGLPAFDGAEGGEEFQCAQAIDSVPEVEFWIRNVSKHPASFFLPTATDHFYPDFVAKLKDGRLLVVEYKGAHLADSDDTNEKRIVGHLWERQSEGLGLFLVVEMKVGDLGMREQILRKILG